MPHPQERALTTFYTVIPLPPLRYKYVCTHNDLDCHPTVME